MRPSTPSPPPDGLTRSLRKRKRENGSGDEDGLQRLVEAVPACARIIVFSGSGLSASAGMSMFSTKGGLYERACKRFKIADGKRLFSWSFYDKQRRDVNAFFADIHKEASRAKPGPSHVAIAHLHSMGRLLRHYTMNVDGLAEQAGMDNWHHEDNPDGVTVELHGNVRYLVCPHCSRALEVDESDLVLLRRHKSRLCQHCNEGALRFKIMLYDDEEAEAITPENVWDLLETDLETADLVIWVGISFEQSASTEYFKKVRRFLQANGRHEQVRQVVVNPSDEAVFNLLSSCSNIDDLSVIAVPATSDTALAATIAAIRADPTALRAAAERFEQERGERAGAAAASTPATSTSDGEAAAGRGGGAAAVAATAHWRLPNGLAWGRRRKRGRQRRRRLGWSDHVVRRALWDAADADPAYPPPGVAWPAGSLGDQPLLPVAPTPDNEQLRYIQQLLAMRHAQTQNAMAASQQLGGDPLPLFLQKSHLSNYALHQQHTNPIGWGAANHLSMAHQLGAQHPTLQQLLAGSSHGLAGSLAQLQGGGLMGPATLRPHGSVWDSHSASTLVNLRAQLMSNLGGSLGGQDLSSQLSALARPQLLGQTLPSMSSASTLAMMLRQQEAAAGAPAGSLVDSVRTAFTAPTSSPAGPAAAGRPPAPPSAPGADAGSPHAGGSPASAGGSPATNFGAKDAAGAFIEPKAEPVADGKAAGSGKRAADGAAAVAPDSAIHAAMELSHALKKPGAEDASDGDGSWTQARGNTTSPDSSPKSA